MTLTFSFSWPHKSREQGKTQGRQREELRMDALFQTLKGYLVLFLPLTPPAAEEVSFLNTQFSSEEKTSELLAVS